MSPSSTTSSRQNSDPTANGEAWWRREIARKAYIAGWKKSRGTEDYSPIQIRTMNSRFERWWDSNYNK